MLLGGHPKLVDQLAEKAYSPGTIEEVWTLAWKKCAVPFRAGTKSPPRRLALR